MSKPEVITVHGREAVIEQLKQHPNSDSSTVFIIFYADPEEGSVSWCPDCRNAEPILRKYFNKLTGDAVVIYCYVGSRPQWKDPNNVFRTDPKYKLTSVPTVINTKTDERIVEGQCLEDKLVKTFFSNGEDSV